MDNDEIKEVNFSFACEHYIRKNVVAKYLAFYFDAGYLFNTLGNASLEQHFNSAVDVFNIDFKDTDKIINETKKILRKKYLLEIVNENPLELKEI